MSKKDEMALLQQLSVTAAKMLSSCCLKSAVMFKHSNFVSKTVLYLGNGSLPFLVESYSHSGNSWAISHEMRISAKGVLVIRSSIFCLI